MAAIGAISYADVPAPRRSAYHPRHFGKLSSRWNSCEVAISKGNPPLRELAKQCGLSLTAVFRHKQHMEISKSQSLKDIPAEIRKLRIMLTKAKRKGDTSAALSISREIRAWWALETKTRPVVPQDSDIATEVPQGELIVLAKALIESRLDDREIQWILTLAERIQAAPVMDAETDEA